MRSSSPSISSLFFQWPIPSSLRHTTQIHAQMVISGLHLHPPATTHLLKSLTKPENGDLSYAITLLHHIPHPTTFQWNSIIMGCTNNHQPREGINLYHQMRQKGAVPNCHTFRVLFRACALSFSTIEGQVIHGGSVRSFDECGASVGSSLIHMYAGFGWLDAARRVFDVICLKDEVLWTTMVGGYAKNGFMVEARSLFDEMPTRNAVAWTSMIAGYSQSGQPDEALQYFRKMVASDVMPDSVTMVSTLSACSQIRDLETGKWVHEFVVREGIGFTKNLTVALVDMYAKCADVNSARLIFDNVGWRFQAAWNAVVDGYSKVGDMETARSLFHQMEDRDCISFNSIITGYVQNSFLKEALLLFAEMRASGLEPDNFTMVGLLTACANLGALNQGKALHALLIESSSIKLDIFIGTALLDMYAKCGRIDQAMQVFDRMSEKDMLAWTAIISGLAMHGKGSLALEHFNLMLKEGIQPNAVAYVGVLNACSHSGLLEEGHKHFTEMKSLYKIEPEIEHYGCMVDLLGRCGCLGDAEELIHSMPMEPNTVIWNSLLGSCRTHKAVDLAEKVAKNILLLEPQDDGVYVQLYNIYISSGRWANASEIRELMEKRGIRKTIGCSSIVVGTQVHKFSAGDHSHPEIVDIQVMLLEMAQRLKQAGYIPSESKITESMDDEEKGNYFFGHSERIAVAYGIMRLGANLPIHVLKNLRICEDCHSALKLIAKLWNRIIIVRDRSRFHHFRDGVCSCNDFW